MLSFNHNWFCITEIYHIRENTTYNTTSACKYHVNFSAIFRFGTTARNPICALFIIISCVLDEPEGTLCINVAAKIFSIIFVMNTLKTITKKVTLYSVFTLVSGHCNILYSCCTIFLIIMPLALVNCRL